jgi:hypothetical protein
MPFRETTHSENLWKSKSTLRVQSAQIESAEAHGAYNNHCITMTKDHHHKLWGQVKRWYNKRSGVTLERFSTFKICQIWGSQSGAAEDSRPSELSGHVVG